MRLVLQQLPSSLRGTARMKLLAPDAADSLLKLEKDTGGLVYTDMWRDAVSSLVARRTRRSTQLPGYSSRNYGFGIDLDIKTILEERKLRYEDLLHFLKKRGWVCYRRDGVEGSPESEHFNFLGPTPNEYLTKCTMDPITWEYPVEDRIFEKHKTDFQITTPKAQELLAKIGFYVGDVSGTNDLYTREAVMAFQRAWDLIENGQIDATLCRVLAFVTSDLEIRSSAPAKVS